MSTRPITIVLAASVEATVALALAVGGLYVLVNTALGNAADASAAIPLAALAFGAASATGYVAWGLFALKEWARTPVLLTQIFICVLAYYMGTSEQYAMAALLVVVAVAGGALVLAPPTTAILFPGDSGSRGRSNT